MTSRSRSRPVLAGLLLLGLASCIRSLALRIMQPDTGHFGAAVLALGALACLTALAFCWR